LLKTTWTPRLKWLLDCQGRTSSPCESGGDLSASTRVAASTTIRARTHDQKNDCFLSWNDKWWLWLCQRRLSSCSRSPASCMRGNLPLAPLCPLPARLPYQHSFASTEGGVGSRGRYHTVCRSSGEYTDGNPRRQAKDPFVEQINNDASRNSGLNLSLRYATVVPYSVLH
jgi:hypothetical protein